MEAKEWLFGFRNLFLLILGNRCTARKRLMVGSLCWGVEKVAMWSPHILFKPINQLLGCFNLWIKILLIESWAQAEKEKGTYQPSSAMDYSLIIALKVVSGPYAVFCVHHFCNRGTLIVILLWQGFETFVLLAEYACMLCILKGF